MCVAWRAGDNPFGPFYVVADLAGFRAMRGQLPPGWKTVIELYPPERLEFFYRFTGTTPPARRLP